MTDLCDLHCEACRSDAPRVSEDEADRLLKQLPKWKMESDGGVPKLKRRFTFKNFKLALEFTQKVGELAEEEDHHPALLTEWGAVKVMWWTHKIGGLHKNDFIMAARTQEIYDCSVT